jgi:hypothetical protein
MEMLSRGGGNNTQSLGQFDTNEISDQFARVLLVKGLKPRDAVLEEVLCPSSQLSVLWVSDPFNDMPCG